MRGAACKLIDHTMLIFYHTIIIMFIMFYSPSEAVRESIDVLEGDIILVATDGLFDNMTDSMILRHLRLVKVSTLSTLRSLLHRMRWTKNISIFLFQHGKATCLCHV